MNASNKQLTELVTECPKIIFRYSDKHCWSCVERALNACGNYKSNSVIKDNIVVIANYHEFRSFRIMHKIYKFGFEEYYYQGNLTYSPEENSRVPYFIVLDCDSIVKMRFLITNDSNELIDSYLNKVYGVFFNDK